ncbi:MAG: flagellar hook-length control protein FliK, partial [Vicinamibacteraceae bacterium]
APASSRAPARPTQPPLRQALSAMAAQAAAVPAPAAGESSAVAASASPVTPPTTSSAPAPVQPGIGSQEGRVSVVSRLASPAIADASTIAPFSASAAGSDTGAAGDGASSGARDGSASSFRPGEFDLDILATGAIRPSATVLAPDALAASLTAPAQALRTGSDALMPAVELPTAARFEQAMQSLDPDVRNLQAMVRSVRLFTASSGASEARLTLEPEHLGPVALTVRVEQGSVSAHFRAETPAAQHWIETHQQELRSGLREQGLEVKELVVTTDPDARREKRQDAPPARPNRARRTQGGDVPRFEVLV